MVYEKKINFIQKILENKKEFLKLLNIIVEKKDKKIYKSNASSIFGDKNKNVLIIGNGPSVKNFELGEMINKSDLFVIRLNNYKIKNFEKYIGSRTDLWTCCLGVTQEPRKIGDIKTLMCQNCPFNIEYNIRDRLIQKILDYKNTKTDIYNITNLYDYFYMRDISKKYTTGMIIILLCVLYFENNIFCYGFDFYKTGKMYYYGKGNINLIHDHKYEEQIFNILKENNWIKPLTNQNDISYFNYINEQQTIKITNQIKEDKLEERTSDGEEILENKKENPKENKKENPEENKKENLKENKKENLEENKKENLKENKKENLEELNKNSEFSNLETEIRIDHIVNIKKNNIKYKVI